MRSFFPELLNRPPLPRQQASSSPPGKKSPGKRRRSNRKSSRGRRRLLTALAIIVAISVTQYLSSGRISWPEALLRTAGESLEKTASGPDAGWRHAADALDTLGAAREGDPVPAFDFTGRVVRVTDGDTVSILDSSNQQHKVRLFGIDTPERDQPHGTNARKALAELVANKEVGVVLVDKDNYGRQVGTLYRGDANINLAMVSAGHAWWYQYYAPHEQRLAFAEEQAQQQRLGLWADPKPIPPWDWRRQRR